MSGGLVPVHTEAFQFDFRVKMLFWFIWLRRLKCKLSRETHLNIVQCEKGEFCNRKRRKRRSIAEFALDIVKDVVFRVLVFLWKMWNWSSPECPNFLTIITLTTPRMFWESSGISTAYISVPHSPICPMCFPRNNWDASHLPWVNIKQILISISVSWNIHPL